MESSESSVTIRKNGIADVNEPEQQKAVAGQGQGAAGYWKLRLYIAGQSERSLTALRNLKRICEKYVPNQYQIEVVDLLENPGLAKGDQIIAIPTLIRIQPNPSRKTIGDLSDEKRVVAALNFPE